MSVSDQEKITIAREYFIRADQGQPDVLELFHDDAEIYFPKFGFGFGRQSFFEMVKGFEGSLEYIRHDYDGLIFIPSGDFLVVEGTSHGKISGKSWAGGKTPGGRFCNVFKFRDGRISSVHVYLYPDYTCEDEARFRWVRIVSGDILKSSEISQCGPSFNKGSSFCVRKKTPEAQDEGL